jgi:vacuolar-type H+-ATPase subunit B/Vma2
LAWKLLSLYPQESLSKIGKDVLKTYYKKRLEEDPELQKFDKKQK